MSLKLEDLQHVRFGRYSVRREHLRRPIAELKLER